MLVRLILLSLIFTPLALLAGPSDMFNNSGLPIPRFVSLKSEEVNARVGPGKRYPIDWVYNRKDLPVEIVEEFGHWRRIRDHSGDGGWVHKNLLGSKRTAIFTDVRRSLYLARDTKSAHTAEVDPQVPMTLVNCDTTWCQMEIREIKGWVERSSIWGLYETETLDKD
jgi:SH3-like domain-containing protein